MLLKSAKVEEEHSSYLDRLGNDDMSHMFNAITFHGKPIVTGSHNLAGQQGSTGMSSK